MWGKGNAYALLERAETSATIVEISLGCLKSLETEL